MKPVSWN